MGIQIVIFFRFAYAQWSLDAFLIHPSFHLLLLWISLHKFTFLTHLNWRFFHRFGVFAHLFFVFCWMNLTDFVQFLHAKFTIDCLERMAIMKSKQKNALMNKNLLKHSFHFVSFHSVPFLFYSMKILLISVELLNEWINISWTFARRFTICVDLMISCIVCRILFSFKPCTWVSHSKNQTEKNWRSEKSWFPWNRIRAVGCFDPSNYTGPDERKSARMQ